MPDRKARLRRHSNGDIKSLSRKNRLQAICNDFPTHPQHHPTPKDPHHHPHRISHRRDTAPHLRDGGNPHPTTSTTKRHPTTPTHQNRTHPHTTQPPPTKTQPRTIRSTTPTPKDPHHHPHTSTTKTHPTTAQHLRDDDNPPPHHIRTAKNTTPPQRRPNHRQPPTPYIYNRAKPTAARFGFIFRFLRFL